MPYRGRTPVQGAPPLAVEQVDGTRRYSYQHFASELRRAREELPADIEARVDKFTVEKLEWFTIFVSVSNWSPMSEVEKAKAEERDSNRCNESGDDYSEPKNDIPFENLRKQLGFSAANDFTMRRFKFPLLQHVRKNTLWGNRNVLEVSCHVDNWLALCAGEHISYMAKHIPWMPQKCLAKSISNSPSESNPDVSFGNASVGNTQAMNIDIERCKFLCQLTSLEPEDSHYEMSLTFLGCSMEMLRSSLAKWTENVPEQIESNWLPSWT